MADLTELKKELEELIKLLKRMKPIIQSFPDRRYYPIDKTYNTSTK